MTTPMSADWNSAEVLEGLDILDKSQLVGVPFRITGVEFQTNSQQISICYIDAERQDGFSFTFLDSSTGIRAQIVRYLSDKGLDGAIESGEYVPLNLVAPNGLRLSEYEVAERGPNGQPIRGKTRTARTYYLTTNGRRPAVKAQNATNNGNGNKTTTAAKRANS